jgi:3-oxoacyl-[acyl-carrier-protein] synthase-3
VPDALVATRTAGVLGLGTAQPPHAVGSAEVGARLGLDADWIVARTGVRERRIAAPGTRLSDLAAEAGAAALAASGTEAAELDLVLVATMTQDELTPNAAPLVAHALGARRAGVMDIGAACTAFLSALSLAAAQVEAGRAERVLVIGADLLSRVTDLDDRRTAPLFADGAGAVVVGPTPAGSGLGPVVLRHDGSGADVIVAHHERRVIEMDGHETFRHAVARLTEVTREAAAVAGLALDEIDLFVLHQANSRITRAVGARLGVPLERVVDSIAEQGNTSAATLPLALAAARADGRLVPGAHVLLAAFGAGFTWGGAVLAW